LYRSFTVFCLKCLSFTNTLAAYYCYFSYINTSQGSVATLLRCGGIVNNRFIVNCPQNVQVKNSENPLTSGEDMDNKKVAQFFLAHSVIRKLMPNVDIYHCTAIHLIFGHLTSKLRHTHYSYLEKRFYFQC